MTLTVCFPTQNSHSVTPLSNALTSRSTPPSGRAGCFRRAAKQYVPVAKFYEYFLSKLTHNIAGSGGSYYYGPLSHQSTGPGAFSLNDRLVTPLT